MKQNSRRSVWDSLVLIALFHCLAGARGTGFVAWASEIQLPPDDVFLGMAAGQFTDLGLKPDATVVGWGDNSYGQLNVPPGLSNVIAIAGDEGASGVLLGNGTMTGWGAIAYPPSGLWNISAIGAGVALQDDGTVRDWHGNVIDRGPPPVVAIAANAALHADGTVTTWGSSLGNDLTPPPGLSNVVAVSTGVAHILALRSDGTLVAWGNNQETIIPPPLRGVVSIASGFSHDLALLDDGSVVAWGQDWVHQCDVPQNLSNVVAIAAGGYHSLALKADGTAVAWGVYYPTQWSKPVPIQVPNGVSNLVSIASDSTHDLGLIGYGPPRISPVTLPQFAIANQGGAMLRAQAIGAWPLHFQWRRDGADLPGRTNSWLFMPDPWPSEAGVYSVTVSNSEGSATSVVARVTVLPAAITKKPQDHPGYIGNETRFVWTIEGDGPFTYQWRFNGVNLPQETNASLTIPSVTWPNNGTYSVIASNRFGTVTSKEARLKVCEIAAWGFDDYAQTRVPERLTNIVAVACGGQYSLALRADGTVYPSGGLALARRG